MSQNNYLSVLNINTTFIIIFPLIYSCFWSSSNYIIFLSKFTWFSILLKV